MAKKDLEVRKETSQNPTVFNPWTDMNQVMERFFSDPFGSILSEMPAASRRVVTNVKETESGYIVSAEIPGIPADDLDINLHGNMLTVRAEHKEEEGKEGSEKGYRREYRSFQQSFSLPSTVDAEKIEANCENGLLEIFLPKTEAAQPKKVAVQRGNGGFLNKLLSKKDDQAH